MSENKIVNTKPMSNKDPAIRVTLLPKDTNANGTIFGGIILSYIDLAAAIEVGKTTSQRAVTKAIKEVIFKAPVRVGDVLSFYTTTKSIGKTSITVEVDVAVLRGREKEVEVTEAEVIYVCVNDKGIPVAVRQED
jgi:acyl-CoA thioesterase YciA